MSRESTGSAPSRLEPTADLNITPLIDILLVLLVLFLVSLPLAQRGLDSNLPTATRPSVPDAPSSQIVIEVTADRQISINHQPIAIVELERRLADLFAARHDKTVYLIGDGALAYGDIVAVIDAARGAGVDKVGIITEGMRRG